MRASDSANMNNDLVSIIIPVYKVEDYLPKCLDSVIAQTYTNLEIVVINDGSPDNCGKILEEYATKDSRIKVITQENQGLSAARNAGLNIMTGNWVCFVDSDDYIATNMVELLLKNASETGSSVSISSYKIIHGFEDTSGVQVNTPSKTISSIKEYCELIIKDHLICGVLHTIYRKDLWNELRFPVGQVHEDLWILPDIIKQNPVVSTFNTPLYYYNQRESSITHANQKNSDSESLIKNYYDRYNALNKFEAFVKNEAPEVFPFFCIFRMNIIILDSAKHYTSSLPYSHPVWKLLTDELKKVKPYKKYLPMQYRIAYILCNISPRFLGVFEDLYLKIFK